MLILLAKEKTEQLKKISNGSTKLLLQYKVVSTDNIPLIHAKLFVIDGKCAIMRSANLTENSFQNFVEYILVTKEIDMVNRIDHDFESFWLDSSSFKNQITSINVKKILNNFKKKL